MARRVTAEMGDMVSGDRQIVASSVVVRQNGAISRAKNLLQLAHADKGQKLAFAGTSGLDAQAFFAPPHLPGISACDFSVRGRISWSAIAVDTGASCSPGNRFFPCARSASSLERSYLRIYSSPLGGKFLTLITERAQCATFGLGPGIAGTLSSVRMHRRSPSLWPLQPQGGASSGQPENVR
jgi:hypothetical protein